MWRELGLHDPFGGHDALRDDRRAASAGPTARSRPCGIDWITTPQPVVLDHWPRQQPAGRSVHERRELAGPVRRRSSIEGETYGLRVHEFRKFAELPRARPTPFELALDIDPADAADLELLRGERLVAGRPAVGGGAIPGPIASYVQGSRAELMVAKNMYVESRSGWFSDRSICYLASGKPGARPGHRLHASSIATGRGPARLQRPRQAAALEPRDLRRLHAHARAARELAEEHFDSKKVLRRLLGKLGIA